MSYVLRPYQQQGLESVRSALNIHKCILLTMPTGTGKMVLGAEILARASKRGNTALFVVHRREMVKQCSEKLGALGVRHAVVLPGEDYSNLERVFVGTVQSVVAQGKRGRFAPSSVRVIVIDEAHHIKPDEGQYRALMDAYPDAVVVGLTATPTRTDGRGLGDVFTHLVQATTYARAFEEGHLVRPRYFAPHVPELEGLRIRAGDYDAEQLEVLMNQPQIVGDIVEHYARYAPDRQGIVFATGVRHSVALRDAFNACGISACHIDGTTPLEERDELIAAYREGQYQVMTNCAVFTEGFDAPATGAVVIARPTKSVILHLQMVGRALRPAPGKPDCMVLDHSGNTLLLGPVEEYEEWALEVSKGANDSSRSKRKAKAARDKVCEECSAIFPAARVCPECGHVHEFEPIPEHLIAGEGELVEVTGKMRAKDKPSPEMKREWYGQLLFVANSKGFSSGWAANQFKAKFGEWPHRKVGIHPTMPTAQVLAFCEAQHQAYREQKRLERLALTPQSGANFSLARA